MRVPSFIYNGSYTDGSAKHLEFEGFKNKKVRTDLSSPLRNELTTQWMARKIPLA